MSTSPRLFLRVPCQAQTKLKGRGLSARYGLRSITHENNFYVYSSNNIDIFFKKVFLIPFFNGRKFDILNQSLLALFVFF